MLILFFLVPVLLAVLLPRLWAAPLLATLALVWALFCIDLSRLHGGASDVMGMVLVSALIQLVLLVLGLRYLFAWRKKPAVVSGLSYRCAQAYLYGLGALSSAVLLTAVSVQICNALFHSSLLTHLTVAVLALAWWMLSPMAWSSRTPRWQFDSLHPSNVFRLVGALAIAGTLLWSLQIAPKVLAAADLASSGQPYCLLAAGPDGVRPARSRFDLTGFAMQARGGSQRHAQLAVGQPTAPQWRYWSYRNAAFDAESMGGVLTCTPTPKFAETLAWMVKTQTEIRSTHFWLGGVQWNIPEEFHFFASDMPALFSFMAQGRDFLPLDKGVIRKVSSYSDQYSKQVQVKLCTPKSLHFWQVESNPNFTVEPDGNEHGLVKQRIKRVVPGEPSSVQFIEYGVHGKAITWLKCDGPGGYCHHAFAREGRVVSFMHPSEQFADWKSLQEAIWLRVKSFVVVWPDLPPQPCDTQEK